MKKERWRWLAGHRYKLGGFSPLQFGRQHYLQDQNLIVMLHKHGYKQPTDPHVQMQDAYGTVYVYKRSPQKIIELVSIRK